MKKYLIVLILLISKPSFADIFTNGKEQCISIIKACSIDKLSKCSVKYCGDNIFKYKLQTIVEKHSLIGEKIENILDFEPKFRSIIGNDFNDFNIQIISYNSVVTMDYNNKRIRVIISSSQKIKEIKIG